MIDLLIGKVEKKNDTQSTYIVNGIGYLINHQPNYHLGHRIYITHIIKEESQTLYGFNSQIESQWFEKLISVKGVGPSKALSILELDSIASLANAIESSDIDYLKRAKGISEQSAKLVIINLKGKVDSEKITNVKKSLIRIGYSRKDINRLDLSKYEDMEFDEIFKKQ